MLIFDFDGVLMDSVDEMIVTGYNAVIGAVATRLEELPGSSANLFRINRFHIQQAGDVIPLMEWCLAHAHEAPDRRLTAEEYQMLKRQARGTTLERTNHFFATRARFVERDLDRWRVLNAPYQPLWSVLQQQGGERVVILTNKNRAATVNLCHHFGLDVRPEHVFSGDHGVTKIDNLLQIQARFRQPPYVFLDDSLANLRELDTHFRTHELTLRLLLALWGYVGPEDADAAQAAGYGSVGQEEAIAMLERELPVI
jgi:FMN phosphatase YigB (HAD superfamily)